MFSHLNMSAFYFVLCSHYQKIDNNLRLFWNIFVILYYIIVDFQIMDVTTYKMNFTIPFKKLHVHCPCISYNVCFYRQF